MSAALDTAAVLGYDAGGQAVTLDVAHDSATILGGAQAGKTRLLLTLARRAAQAGDVLVWAADLTPTRALARTLDGRVDWLATDAHTLQLQVQMASALAHWRSLRWAADIALTGDTPCRKLPTSPARPAVLLLVDTPTFAADTMAEQAAYGGLARLLAEQSGVPGVPLHVATPYPLPGSVTKHARAVHLRRDQPSHALMRRTPRSPWTAFTTVDPYTIEPCDSGAQLEAGALLALGPTYTGRSTR